MLQCIVSLSVCLLHVILPVLWAKDLERHLKWETDRTRNCEFPIYKLHSNRTARQNCLSVGNTDCLIIEQLGYISVCRY